jgi:hypothetical protein
MAATVEFGTLQTARDASDEGWPSFLAALEQLRDYISIGDLKRRLVPDSGGGVKRPPPPAFSMRFWISSFSTSIER